MLSILLRSGINHPVGENCIVHGVHSLDSEIEMGAALIKHLVKYCFTIEFVRARQAASRTVKSRCLAFTPVSERSRFPAAPYLATCLLRASAPPTGLPQMNANGCK